MSRWLLALSLALGAEAQACLGPESERAQERDASVVFVGRPVQFQVQASGNHALVTFDVIKTMRGEARRRWELYFRAREMPADLGKFRRQFGDVLEVGARSMIAPGAPSGSNKKAYYVVDAACDLEGGDWLLRKVKAD